MSAATPSTATPGEVTAQVLAAPTRVRHLLGLGDDSLVMAQRLGEWLARAPELEEDLALANIGLDQLGQARALLTLAGSLLDPPRSEDDLAYLREDRAFANAHLVERPWSSPHAERDFAVAVVRLLLLATYQCALYRALAGLPGDEQLAAVAAKAVKEVDYHRDHARSWLLRLGDGTAYSHDRAQAALGAEWPFLAELLEDDGVSGLDGLVAQARAVAPSSLRADVEARLADDVAAATLRLPADAPAVTGGRRGRHSEHLGHLLADLQHLHRSHPGAAW